MSFEPTGQKYPEWVRRGNFAISSTCQIDHAPAFSHSHKAILEKRMGQARCEAFLGLLDTDIMMIAPLAIAIIL